MSKRFSVRLHVVAILYFSASAAQAMVGGTPAPDRLLNVATTAVKVGGEWTWYGCTGTMISPRVFATVAHCNLTPPQFLAQWYPQLAGMDHWEAGITFSPDVQQTDYFNPLPPEAKVYPAKVVIYPGWSWDDALGLLFDGSPSGFVDTSEEVDVAVYLLDEPVPGVHPAKLVEEGFFDRNPRSLRTWTFGFAGYGMGTREACDGNATPDFGVRRYAPMRYERTYRAKVDLRGDRACAEDSGGPVFLVDNDDRRIPRYVETLAGTLQDDPTSSQSGLDDVFNRLDTPKAQRFLRRFLRDDGTARGAAFTKE